MHYGFPTNGLASHPHSGVTRLLLMPGQRAGKPPTHAAHTHMSIFIWTSVFFSKYVVLAILYVKYLS